MRLLVCGSRSLVPWPEDFAALASFLLPGTTLIHGAARGADRFAAEFAEGLGLTVIPFPADWNGPCRPECIDCRCKPGHRRPYRNGIGDYCPKAGTHRNALMLRDGRPDAVLAFLRGAGRGTFDMLTRAKAAGLPIYGSPQPVKRDTRTPLERLIDEACGVPR